MNQYVFYGVSSVAFLIIWLIWYQTIKDMYHDKKPMAGDGLIAMCLAALTYMAIGAGVVGFLKF